MSVEIKFNETDGIVDIKYNGLITLEERIKALDDGCALYEDNQPYLVLVDVRELIMGGGVLEQVLFAEYLASQPELNGSDAKVAVLHKEGKNPYEMLTTLVNLKDQNRVGFSDEKQAREWLTAT